jgi:hypothetical protein
VKLRIRVRAGVRVKDSLVFVEPMPQMPEARRSID